MISEEEKEVLLEKQMRGAEEAVRVVEKDILRQSESLQKRLAARKKSKDVHRSFSALNNSAGNLNRSQKFNISGIKLLGDSIN